MKTVIILTLAAFAAAIPTQYNIETRDSPYDKYFSGEYTWLDKYFGQGNNFQVPQYIAYQFHVFQQMSFSPDQVSHYLIQHGYPMHVVQYLAHEYEAGLDKPYFQTPYLMYQYYHEQSIPQELQEFINHHIYNYFHQFQKYLVTYGLPHVFEQEYSVPFPFSQYMSHQLRFYTQKGFNFEQPQVGYQYLESALHYTQNVMQYFVRENTLTTRYAHIFEHLHRAFDHLQQAHQVHQSYLMHETQVPYYVFQYYVQHVQHAFYYFQNVYQHLQKEHVAFPESFIYHVQHAYFAIQKVHHMYEFVNWFDYSSMADSSHLERKQWNYDYEHQYPITSQEPHYNWFGKYMDKDSSFNNQIYGAFGKFYNYYQYYPHETSQYKWGYEPTYHSAYRHYTYAY